MENNFIINLQKSPKFIFKLMNLISLPFSINFYPLIIAILYYENIIDTNQLYLILIGNVICGLVKNIIKRNRPYVQSNEILNYEKRYLDSYSFPSMHTFNAFLLFYILRSNGVINNYYKIIPYSIAISRIFLGVHYPTDVIIGAILAKVVFSIFVNNNINIAV